MKVVFASTPEQEEKIVELVNKFYADIFPMYFSDEDIQEFERLNVLRTTTRHFEYFGTLGEAYQVISGMQTIIAILEGNSVKAKYERMFNKNVKILERFEITFPFSFHHFYNSKMVLEEQISAYMKPANQWLV